MHALCSHTPFVLLVEPFSSAIRGLIVMNPSLEQVFSALFNGQVPAVWDAASYPSTKPLAGYAADLLARLVFFDDWVKNGAPTVFWLSGFYFTQVGVVVVVVGRMHGVWVATNLV